MKRIFAFLFSVFLAVSSLPVSSVLAAEPSLSDDVYLRVLVDIAADASPADILEDVPGARLLAEYSLIDSFAAELPAASLSALCAQDGVLAVTREATFGAPAAYDESEISALPEISPDDQVLRATDAQAGSGTLIAVLDTGFYTEHALFTLPAEAAEKITADSFADAVTDTRAVYVQTREKIDELYLSPKIPFAYDYVDDDGDVSCSSSHGTHVAATAAGYGEINGTAPGAQLALMKVFDDSGSECPETALLLAVEDAVLLGADVINLSLGSLSHSSDTLSMQRLARALQEASKRGIVVVCAVGNDGKAGSLGTKSQSMSAENPDYGLPSEPAVLSSALAVGAYSNAVVYGGYLRAGERNILYDEPQEVSNGAAESMADALGGKSFSLAVIPGVGEEADYKNRNVSGKIVLVRRGTITFAEKVRIAAENGAAGVIIYNHSDEESMLMSLGGEVPVPAVSVSLSDGEYLAAMDGETVFVSKSDGVFAADEAVGIASYSSWGPTSDLHLKPDLAAVGSYVVSASADGGYAVMSGTSMAAPQVAGMAATVISRYGDRLLAIDADQRSAAVRAYLISSARPILAGEDRALPISPRAQGAGVLHSLDSGILLSSETGGALELGDELQRVFTMTARITNLTDTTRRLRLSAVVETDDAAETDGVYYTTGTPQKVPVKITRPGGASLTLQAGETAEFTLTVTVDADFDEEWLQIFTNGYYLEGYIFAEDEDGTYLASVPFLGYRGDWESIPLLDGGDWDGYESYYGNQLLYRPVGETLDVAGITPDGVFSALFAFSPDGDGDADSVFFRICPFRNIALCEITVVAGDGTVVFENAGVDILKSYPSDGQLVASAVRLWDGSDGKNTHYIWEDGAYTVQLRLTGYTGATQYMEIPLRLDTKKPTVTSCVLAEDGALSVTAEDDGAIRSIRVYLPDGDDAYLADETFAFSHTSAGSAHTEQIRVTLPESVVASEYIYIRVEDQAGNVTVVRHYFH